MYLTGILIRSENIYISNMQTRSIYLRKMLTSKLIKYHGFKFLNRTDFGSNYIYIRTKLVSDDCRFKSLGMKFIINLNNKGEIISYINYIIEEYNDKHLLNYKPEDFKVMRLDFTWIPTSENDYKDFIKNYVSSRK